jgi:putative intracellular protease/amidase
MRLKIALSALIMALLACSIPGDITEQLPDEGEAPSAAETAEPVVTEAPSPTPEPTATPEPTPEPFPGASNACSHPYYPVVDGATWVYESGLVGEEPELYTVTTRNVTGDTFEFVQRFEEGEFNITWECTEAGLLQTTYASANVGNDALEFELETVSVDGLTFPEEFVPGATWQTRYETVANVEGFDSPLDFDIVIDYTYTTDEEVTVPAGTFTAARVEQVLVISSSGLGTEQTSNAVSWYAEDVGLVRNESEFAGFASYYELAEYEFPE